MLNWLRVIAVRLSSPPWPQLAAWICVAILIFVTVCPIGLRPKVGPPNAERYFAYVLTGFAFLIAYRRRHLTVILGIAALAACLEFAQLFIPTRDARVPDALVKVAGGETGIAVAWLVMRLLPDWFTSSAGKVSGAN